jgi:hypothetical protein
MPRKSQINYLGLTLPYPKTIPDAIFCLILVALLVGLNYAALGPRVLELTSIITGRHYNNPADPSEFRESKQTVIQFWTPSEKTCGSIGEAAGEQDNKWMCDAAEPRVKAFGNILHRSQGVTGYRRYAEFGHGSTFYKEGWWWVVSVSNDFKIADFLKTYAEYWKDPRHGIYVEDSMGGRRR